MNKTEKDLQYMDANDPNCITVCMCVRVSDEKLLSSCLNSTDLLGNLFGKIGLEKNWFTMMKSGPLFSATLVFL